MKAIEDNSKQLDSLKRKRQEQRDLLRNKQTEVKDMKNDLKTSENLVRDATVEFKAFRNQKLKIMEE